MSSATHVQDFEHVAEQELLGGSLTSTRWHRGVAYASFPRDQATGGDRSPVYDFDNDAASARISVPPLDSGGSNEPRGGGGGGGNQGGGFTSVYEMQAQATNAILTSFGQGNYDGNYEQFEADLQSIQDWDNAQWIDPDHNPLGWGGCAFMARLPQEVLVAECGDPPSGTCVTPDAEAIEQATDSLELLIMESSLFDDSDDERRLIEMAWTVLYENFDLVRWAACYVEGERERTLWFDRSLADCLHRKMTRSSRTLIVLTSEHVCSPAFACTYIDPLWGMSETIHINRGTPEWQRYLQAFSEDELCGATALAGSILHELWHMCREFRFEDSFSSTPNCTDPVLLENLFRMALYARCPIIATVPCCAEEADEVQDPYADVLVYPC